MNREARTPARPGSGARRFIPGRALSCAGSQRRHGTRIRPRRQRESFRRITVWAQAIGLLVLVSLDKGFVHGYRSADSARSQDAWPATLWWLRLLMPATCLAAWLLAAVIVPSQELRPLFVASVVGTLLGELVAARLLASARWKLYSAWRVTQPATYAAGCVAVALLVDSRDAVLVLLLVFLAHVLSFSIPIALAEMRLPLRLGLGRWNAYSRAGISFGTRYHVSTLCNQLSGRLDLLIAPLIYADRLVGVYAVAVAPGSVLAVLGAGGAMRALVGTPTGRRRAFTALAAATLTVATLVPVVLPWLFGDSFKGAVVPALILVAAGALSYPMQWAIGRLAFLDSPARGALVHVPTIAAVGLAAALGAGLTALAVSVLLGRLIGALLSGLLVARIERNGERANSQSGERRLVV